MTNRRTAFSYVFGQTDGPCKLGVTNNPISRARSIVAYLPGARLGRGATMLWQTSGLERKKAERVERDALAILAGREIRVDKQPWQQWRTEWFQVCSDQAIAALTSSLKAAGVEFIDSNGGGPGVRLRQPHP